MSQNQRPPEAFRATDLFEEGFGPVCVSRFKSGGRVETGLFLVDTFCLGVKDALFRQSSSEAEYEEFLENAFLTGRTKIAPAEARKLVEQAVAYAAKLGLAPAADYKKGARVFGGIRAEDWPGDFTFGKDGKPFFVSGPSDTPARCEQVLGALERSFGPGNYDYLVEEDLDDFELEEDQPEDDDSRTAAMLEEICKEGPRKIVVPPPPGLPKLSDLLKELAKPLMPVCEDIESVRNLFDLAMVAWNYPLDPASLQSKTKREIRRMAGAEGVAMYEMLIERRLSLYPDDRRRAVEVEIDVITLDEINVRVAYTMDPNDLPGRFRLPESRVIA